MHLPDRHESFQNCNSSNTRDSCKHMPQGSAAHKLQQLTLGLLWKHTHTHTQPLLRLRLTFLPCSGYTPVRPRKISLGPQESRCHWSHYKGPMKKTHKQASITSNNIVIPVTHKSGLPRETVILTEVVAAIPYYLTQPTISRKIHTQ